MAKDTGKPGLKSAFDLAMERLEQKGGRTPPLNAEQKKALADIDSQAKAGMAEVEIMMNQRLAEARGKGDAEALQKLEEQKQTDLRRIRDRADADKERVRRG